MTGSHFADELVKAMAARSMTGQSLAKAVGCKPDAVTRWRSNRGYPTIWNALGAAEALDWPKLREIATAELGRRCARPSCRKRYFASPRHRWEARFCSAACQVSTTRARYKARKRKRGTAHLALLERAVAAHCRGCEPLGFCRDAACALRPVSPLPLVKRSVA